MMYGQSNTGNGQLPFETTFLDYNLMYTHK